MDEKVEMHTTSSMNCQCSPETNVQETGEFTTTCQTSTTLKNKTSCSISQIILSDVSQCIEKNDATTRPTHIREVAYSHTDLETVEVKNKEDSGQLNDGNNEYLATEHCYSRPFVKLQNTPESMGEMVITNNEQQNIVLDESIHECIVETTENDFNTNFVSSMIEVINDANEKENSSEDSSVCSSDSDSSESDSTTSDSSTDPITVYRNEDVELKEEIAVLKKSTPPKVFGEVLCSELPPVEDLHISLPDDCVFECIGKISQITPDNTVVVQSSPNKPALDAKTVLFLAKNNAIGTVDDTFGPVTNPYYTIRFNSREHIGSKDIQLERDVFYAPHVIDFTSFIFVSQLKNIKGSDASWKNDHEPPPSCLDYSDDEKEREARKMRRNKNNANNLEGSSQENITGPSATHGRGRRSNHWHNKRVRVQVTESTDPSQSAWQNAVDKLPSARESKELGPHHSNHANAPLTKPMNTFSPYPYPPPNFFQPPPPPPPAFSGMQAPPAQYCDSNASFLRGFPPPPGNWCGPWSHQERHPIFNCMQPPPPPPPP